MRAYLTMEIMYYRKLRLNKQILEKVKRIPTSVASYSRCLECNNKLHFWNRKAQPLCESYCRMRHEDRLFRSMCGGC
jgi:hypothetical protein